MSASFQSEATKKPRRQRVVTPDAEFRPIMSEYQAPVSSLSMATSQDVSGSSQSDKAGPAKVSVQIIPCQYLQTVQSVRSKI